MAQIGSRPELGSVLVLPRTNLILQSVEQDSPISPSGVSPDSLPSLICIRFRLVVCRAGIGREDKNMERARIHVEVLRAALNRSLRILLGLALVASLAVAESRAQTARYPDKPIKMLVGFSAGGGTD